MDNLTESQFYGPNLGYVLELYERYKEDPSSVDERTRSFFENWSPPRIGTNGEAVAWILWGANLPETRRLIPVSTI